MSETPKKPTRDRSRPVTADLPKPRKPKGEKRPKKMLSMGEPEFITPSIIIQAVEGWGKTTLAANAPTPLVLQCGGETGYQTLLNAGSVPKCYTDQVDDWKELLNWLDDIADPETDYDIQTLVIDSLSGASEMCREYVCNENFKGDWGHGTQTGYAAFNKGDGKVAPAEWKIFDQKLGKINRLGIIVIQLAHTAIERFENPLGEEEARYTSSIPSKFWELSKRNADIILFGNYDPTRDEDGKESMNTSIKRILHSQYRDAWQAKNRFNMVPHFEIPNDPSESWETLWGEIHRNIRQPE